MVFFFSLTVFIFISYLWGFVPRPRDELTVEYEEVFAGLRRVFILLSHWLNFCHTLPRNGMYSG